MAIRENYILIENPKAMLDWMKFFNRIIADFRSKCPVSVTKDEDVIHLMLISMVKKEIISEHEEGYFLLGEWEDVEEHLKLLPLDFN